MTETLQHTSSDPIKSEMISVDARDLSGIGTDPLVSMDVNLAKDLELSPDDIVHVDYPNLRKTLDAVGAPADNSDLDLEFSSNLPGDSMYGEYSPDKRHAVVGITPGDFEESQKSLQHELKHYADDVVHGAYKESLTNKLYDPVYYTSSKYGNKLVAAGGVAMAGAYTAEAVLSAALIYEKLDYYTYVNLFEIAHNAVGTSGIFSLGAVALWGVYFGDKYERRARKAEKKINLPSTIKIESAK